MEAMKFYPAIDLINKECVRLEKGNFQKKTVFNKDPVRQAKSFENVGCKWLHVVDLDAAKDGHSENDVILKEIKIGTDLNIQFGGGLRSIEKIDELFSLGIDRAIIGTAAVENMAFLESATQRHSEKIWLGVDILKNEVRIEGWTKKSDMKVVDLIKAGSDLGVGGIILTDINKDGMMDGPNIELTLEIAEQSNIPIIISGGVSKIEDIIKIKTLENKGIEGAICGRAIYNGEIDIDEALNIFGDQNA